MDFSCGIGNHSIPLSNMGYSVVGYDPSKFYLQEATNRSRADIRDVKNKPKFILGNPYCSDEILLKNNERYFDVIIIMDNSFGYFDMSRDIHMLKHLLKVAKKNCIIIMETENRDWRLLNFEPVTVFDSKSVMIYAKWKFDFERSVSVGALKFYERCVKDASFRLSLELEMIMRLYSLHELIQLISKSGWRYLESYDDIISLTPFTNESMSIFSASSAR